MIPSNLCNGNSYTWKANLYTETETHLIEIKKQRERTSSFIHHYSYVIFKTIALADQFRGIFQIFLKYACLVSHGTLGETVPVSWVPYWHKKRPWAGVVASQLPVPDSLFLTIVVMGWVSCQRQVIQVTQRPTLTMNQMVCLESSTFKVTPISN